MAKKPEPPKSVTWTIYKLAAKQERLGRSRGAGRSSGNGEGRGGISGVGQAADGNTAVTTPCCESFCPSKALMAREAAIMSARSFGPMTIIWLIPHDNSRSEGACSSFSDNV